MLNSRFLVFFIYILTSALLILFQSMLVPRGQLLLPVSWVSLNPLRQTPSKLDQNIHHIKE